MKLLMISLMLGGCGYKISDTYPGAKTEHKVETVHEVKGEATVNVNVNLNINVSEEVNKICADAKDKDKCRTQVLNFYSNIVKAVQAQTANEGADNAKQKD